ncbi:MAG: hypothetical protein ABH849_02550 [Nanoarchaeota archaeon]
MSLSGDMQAVRKGTKTKPSVNAPLSLDSMLSLADQVSEWGRNPHVEHPNCGHPHYLGEVGEFQVFLDYHGVECDVLNVVHSANYKIGVEYQGVSLGVKGEDASIEGKIFNAYQKVQKLAKVQSSGDRMIIFMQGLAKARAFIDSE